MQEKKHPPSARKLREARRKGDVVHSNDIASALSFIVMLVALWLMPGALVDLLRALWERACDPDLWAHADTRWIDVTRQAGAVLLIVCVPICVLAVLASGFGSFLQVGALAAWNKLLPDMSRLNPGAGLTKLFSLNNVIELAKMLLKVLLLGVMLVAVTREFIGMAARVGYLTPAGQLAVAGHLVMMMLAWAAVIFAALAPVDYLHRHFDFMKKQRMSIQELIREHHETEGSPLTQSRRRAVHIEETYSSLAERVRYATLVVHSHTVAVALQYVSVTDPPRVVAMGLGAVAEQICRMAREQMLYVELNPALTDRLQREVALDRVAPLALAPALLALLRRAQSSEP